MDRDWTQRFDSAAQRWFPGTFDDALGRPQPGIYVVEVGKWYPYGGGGVKDLPPYLEGIKVDGRWAVIYSKYDVGCALEGHKSSDCLGHDRDSALRIASAAVLYALKR